MKNSVKILAIIVGAVGAAALLNRKRADGSSMFDDISEKGKHLGDKIAEYGTQIKDKFMPDKTGPNGESVFSDMYDRHYYMDDTDTRIYTDS